MIVTKTPHGLSLLGGIGCAIEKYSFVTVRQVDDFCQGDTLGETYREEVENAVHRQGMIRSEVAVSCLSEVACGAVQAVRVGVRNALSAVRGRFLTCDRLAGTPEEHWSACGGFGYHDQKNGSFFPFINAAGLEDYVLFFPNFYEKARTPTNQKAINALNRITEQGVHSAHREDWLGFANAMDVAWPLTGPSDEESLRVYARARAHGAAGGVAGGFLLLVVPPKKRAAVAAAMREEGLKDLPFHFSFIGSRVVYVDK